MRAKMVSQEIPQAGTDVVELVRPNPLFFHVVRLAPIIERNDFTVEHYAVPHRLRPEQPYPSVLVDDAGRQVSIPATESVCPAPVGIHPALSP